MSQDSQLTFSATDEMENQHEVLKENFSDKVIVFDGHPPAFPPRPLVANIEGVSQTFANIVVSGNTKPFRDAFDLAGILK